MDRGRARQVAKRKTCKQAPTFDRPFVYCAERAADRRTVAAADEHVGNITTRAAVLYAQSRAPKAPSVEFSVTEVGHFWSVLAVKRAPTTRAPTGLATSHQ